MQGIKLSIVIVNWNAEKLLRECLASLAANVKGFGIEIIVVDNASQDGSVSMVRREFPQVSLLENLENLGFAKANNQGIKKASGEYVLLLNNDAIIDNKAVLEGWLDFMDRHPRVAASGCKLIFPDGNHQVGDAGFKPSLASVISYAVFLSKIFPRAFKSIFLNYDKYSKPLKVDWISGAALMLRKSVLKDTGLLNEDIFMFAEDVELGCRINSHGYDVFYLPYLTITHRQGSSVEKQKDKEDFSFLWFKNLRRLYFYYNKKEPVIIYDMIMICAFLLRSILYYLIYITTGNAAKKTKFDKLSGYLNFAIRNLGKPVNGYGNS